jgi:uncharacterized protein YggU (UPF0235/DUF167 family)
MQTMYIRVKVFPDAKKEVLKETGGLRYEVRVRVPAERNLANTRVREVFAGHFGLPVGLVRIVSGHTSPNKILSISEAK